MEVFLAHLHAAAAGGGAGNETAPPLRMSDLARAFLGAHHRAVALLDAAPPRSVGADMRSDVLVESHYLVVKLCLEHGALGVLFVVCQFLPWLLKVVVMFVKWLDAEFDLLARENGGSLPGALRYPRLVRRMLWIVGISFLVDWGFVFYIQRWLDRPALRPDCSLLRGTYGWPAQDSVLLFHLVFVVLLTAQMYGVQLPRSRRLFWAALPFLNALGLYMNGLHRLDELVAGGVLGIVSAILWSRFILAYVSRSD